MMTFGVWFWLFCAFVGSVTASYNYGSGDWNKGKAELISAFACMLLAFSRYLYNR